MTRDLLKWLVWLEEWSGDELIARGGEGGEEIDEKGEREGSDRREWCASDLDMLGIWRLLTPRRLPHNRYFVFHCHMQFNHISDITSNPSFPKPLNLYIRTQTIPMRWLQYRQPREWRVIRIWLRLMEVWRIFCLWGREVWRGISGWLLMLFMAINFVTHRIRRCWPIPLFILHFLNLWQIRFIDHHYLYTNRHPRHNRRQTDFQR